VAGFLIFPVGGVQFNLQDLGKKPGPWNEEWTWWRGPAGICWTTGLDSGPWLLVKSKCAETWELEDLITEPLNSNGYLCRPFDCTLLAFRCHVNTAPSILTSSLKTDLLGTTWICFRNLDKVDICESGLINVGGSRSLENNKGPWI
jgi:hypothetical protein